MLAKTKKKNGRPEIVITAKMVKQIEVLAGYGLNQEEISIVIGISHDVLTKHKKLLGEVDRAIKGGKAKGKATIGKRLFDKAKGGDLASIIRWENTRTAFQEKQKTEHTGPDGGPIETVFNINFVKSPKVEE